MTKEQGEDELEKHFLEEVRSKGYLSSLVRLSMEIEDKRFMKIFDLMQNFYKVDPLLPKEEYLSSFIKEQEANINIIRDSMINTLIANKAPNRCVKQFQSSTIKELFVKKLFENDKLGDHSWFAKVSDYEIEEIYSSLKDALLEWTRTKESIILYHLFENYDYYRNATITNAKSSGVLSFDDLTYFTFRLLHESISKEFLYFKIDAKFKHILLDEFQDTSTLQFLLLQPLIDEIFAGYGSDEFKSFFYVGDTKQSLYRFRGGVEELFERVAENYGIKIEQMDTNYRSAKNIVEQVNRWFEPNMEDYKSQYSREGASEGFVEVLESEKLIEEAVTQVKRLIKLGVKIDDIAILVSTNKDGQNLQEACQKEGIDTLLKTSSSLKSMPRIASLVSMVSYLFYKDKIDSQSILENVGKSIADIDTSWFSVFMTPLKVLDRLVREFGYFDNDLNILKLLEFASSFSDIVSFLEEFETSRISVASNSVHGAKIMTIHSSKGLEFDYVILLDKLTRPNSDTTALIYNYKTNLYIDRVVYRIKGRENFDKNYATIMEQRKKSALKDKKNVLYVALTRAVESLIVIKKQKSSIFDEIGISPMSLGRLEVRYREAKQKIQEFKNINISNYGVQEVAKEEKEEEKDYEALFFGTALHYTLEMLGSFDEVSLELAIISLKNRYGQQLTQNNIDDIRVRVKHLIEDQQFQDMHKEASIIKEQSFSFDGELKQLDLLLEYQNKCLVLEYKSSKKYSFKHIEQIKLYKKAISNILDKPTKGVIVYLLKNGVEMVEV